MCASKVGYLSGCKGAGSTRPAGATPVCETTCTEGSGGGSVASLGRIVVCLSESSEVLYTLCDESEDHLLTSE